MTYLALWIAIGFSALVALGLVYEVQALRRQIQNGLPMTDDSLAIGSTVPSFYSQDICSGTGVSRSSLERGNGALFLFVSTSCPKCRIALASLNGMLPLLERLSLVVICAGKEADCQFLSQRLCGQASVIHDGDREIATLFRAHGYPTTIAVDSTQKVRAVTHAVQPADFRQLVGAVSSERKTVPEGATEGEVSTI